MGFFAFAVTILLGLSAGNPAEVTLTRAVQALFVFCLIGLCVGWVANRVLDEHAVRRNRELFPDDSGGAPADAKQADASKPPVA